MCNMLFFDVLACPAYEHFVIHVRLDSQTWKTYKFLLS